MRYRQFYTSLKTDSTAYHEHGAEGEANITIQRRDRNGTLYQHGRVEIELCSDGLRIRLYNAPGELVAELLNGILLPAS